MTNSARLERRYRLLPALYQKAFRCEHEPEMLSALMAGAAEGQGRPRLGEVVNLVGNAIFCPDTARRSMGAQAFPADSLI